MSEEVAEYEAEQTNSQSKLSDGLNGPVCDRHKDRKAAYERESFIKAHPNVYMCVDCEQDMYMHIKIALKTRDI